MNNYKMVTPPNIESLSKLTMFFFIALLTISIVGCKEIDTNERVFETGTVTDVDGNVYQTVKIGNQWWMTENLKVTKFRNGDAIIQAQDSADWVNPQSNYCLYRNDLAAPGFLYNFYSITDAKNIAPEGWHIPTDSEWKELEVFLGMSNSEADKTGWRGNDEGSKLKIEGAQGWTENLTYWPTNESGFTAKAGSCRLFDGTFGEPGLFVTGFWWTANQESSDKAWYRYLDYKNGDIFRYYDYKSYGFSVRCVKNN
jgi:hypothetical protein